MILWTFVTLALSYISFKRPVNEGSWFARGLLFAWLTLSICMFFVGIDPNIKE